MIYVLYGQPGSGKTTLGRLLAEHLDTPHLIELGAAIGNWGLFARLLRSLNVPLEEGIDPWPPDGLSPADADTGSDDGAVR